MRINIKLLLTTVILLSACSKEKADLPREDPFNENITSSYTRVVLAGGMDIKVNGTKLSNWLAGSSVGGGPSNPPNPTPYFPTTGKPGNTYFIPGEFISGDGNAVVELYNPGATAPMATATVEDSYAEPLDYYYNMQGYPEQGVFTPVPRPIVKPSQPQNILVRLVNLASSAVPNSGDDETLSLAYADGMPVNSITSGIAKGHWSEYVEIPYGTYEFRVLIDDTQKQYPAAPPFLQNINSSDDMTLYGKHLYFTQRRVFQPGGVYTIIVSFDRGRFQDNNGVKLPVNLFSFITDVSLLPNISYARVQVANAFSEKGIQIKVDGASLPSVLFGKSGDYVILTAGTHTLTLQNEDGTIQNEEKITVKGGDNFTVWTYPGQDGKIASMVVQNNMSGIINNAGNEDGSDGSTAVSDPLTLAAMNVQVRFLNLCPELPYVSFTTKNGISLAGGNAGYPAAATNLQYGMAPDAKVLQYPYLNVSPAWIEAYASKPQSVPGDRLYGVQPLTSEDFISMSPVFYPNGLPDGEPGIYTVALAGHYNGTSQPGLIVIKHNK